jgi:hypothetical protein
MTQQPALCDINPTLITCGDRKYAVGGSVWILVPFETQYEDLPKYLVKRQYEEIKVIKKYNVSGTGKKYLVEVMSNKEVRCECSGFKWRKKCKHADKIIKLGA